MRVLLIQPPLKKIDKLPYAPLSLMSIGTEIEAVGNEVQILDLDLESHLRQELFDRRSVNVVERTIVDFQPDVVGMSAICSSFPIATYLAQHIKNSWPNMPIVVGGPHISLIAEEVLTSHHGIDIAVVGEGEFTCRELFAPEGLRVEGVMGILYRNDSGEIVDNGRRDLAEHLDDFLPLNYDLVNMAAYTDRGVSLRSHYYHEVGRGCPFACRFCSTSLMWGRKYRAKSPERLVCELKYLRDNYGIESVDLLHDHLTSDPKYVRALCEVLRCENLGVRWSCSARADCIDSELLHLMQQAGCYNLNIGIETGSTRMQKAVNKGLNIEKAIGVAQQCAKDGIRVSSSYIVGFPNELPEDYEKTLEVALKFSLIGKTLVQIHKYMPHPATELYRDYKSAVMPCEHMPYFVSWNEQEIPLMETVRAHPNIYSSFYHIPSDSGGERAMFDSEYIFCSLINYYPRTLLYLRKYGRVLFSDIVRVYQNIEDHYDARYTMIFSDMEKLLKATAQGVGIDTDQGSLFYSVLQYEKNIQGLFEGSIQRAARPETCQDAERVDGGRYVRNPLIRLETLPYDISHLTGTLISDGSFQIDDGNSAYRYAFVFWRDRIEVYEMGETEYRSLATLPDAGTDECYMQYFEDQGFDQQKGDLFLRQLRATHVII